MNFHLQISSDIMFNVRAMLEMNIQNHHTKEYGTILLGDFLLPVGYICSAL